MRKLYQSLVFLCMMMIPAFTFGQALPPLQPEQDACNALELCGTVFNTPYSYSGFGQVQEQVQFGTNAGCFSESNSVWLHLKVIGAGTIVFAIHPYDSTNDYDFAVYDITGNNNCATIATNGNRIRCNGNTILPYGTIPGGIIGLNNTSTLTYVAAGTVGSPFCQYIAAPVGGEYLIMIDNFSASASGFYIDFTGSTAIFDQGTPPALDSLVPACSMSEKVNVHLTKAVKCSSIAPDGSDFFLTPSGTMATAVGSNCSNPNGYTSLIQLTFAAPLGAGNYVLNTQVGTDGNTLIDLCGNALVPPDTLQFHVAPASNPNMISLDTPACFNARIALSHKVLCSTIDGNGSDFKVTGPGPVQVVHASGLNCNADGLADTLSLQFDNSIRVPGTYTLSVVVGDDGDRVTDSCGYSVINTISWVVSDKGFLNTTATPNLLCKPGYVVLDAQPLIGAPLEQVNCGVNGSVCTTPSNPYPVGDPNAAGAILNSPFYGDYSDGRTQMLFTAGQLHAAGINAGTITQLAVNITFKASTVPFNGFTIKMLCTDKSALTSFLPDAKIVYTPKNYSTVSGVNTFVLDRPYDWDGVSNLMVEMCYHSSNLFTGSDYIQTTPGVSPGVVLHYQDIFGDEGCNLTADTMYFPPSADRPNITFTQCSPPTAGYSQQWTPSAYVGDTTAFNTAAYVKATTIYKIQILDTNRCYRRDTSKVTVSVRHPYLYPQDTAICYGNSVQLNAGGGDTYQWFPTTGLSCATCANPTATPLVNTTYHVAIIDQYGCSDTLSIPVIVHPLPVISAGIDTGLLYGQSIVLQGYAPTGMYFLWDPVTALSDPNILNPVASPEVTTKYALLVIDSNQCQQRDTVKVTVRTNVPLFVPTAFSPDGDGRNDLFRVVNLTFQRIAEFRVFNRWGQEIFSADNNNGWNGTFKGVAQESGVYNYIIRVAWPDGQVTTYKGNVTLVR
ncbi:gliding motility-associated C-terminal domain-containing protein [Chitinophagaceae bacterium MMS25-I14]